ncbi:hypothetical protein C8R44DRAFT_865058 [Mycena epipterygia]|nr:hypothetical protein C8R44DRAFT_865058 [Mycena epipterygia]
MLPRTDQWAYRIQYALQWMWSVPLLIGVALAPESPWWLVRRGRIEDAKRALLMLTSLDRETDFDADEIIAMMRHTRCNSFTGYSAYFLEQAGLAPAKSYDFALGQYGINMAGIFGAWALIARRRGGGRWRSPSLPCELPASRWNCAPRAISQTPAGECGGCTSVPALIIVVCAPRHGHRLRYPVAFAHRRQSLGRRRRRVIQGIDIRAIARSSRIHGHRVRQPVAFAHRRTAILHVVIVLSLLPLDAIPIAFALRANAVNTIPARSLISLPKVVLELALLSPDSILVLSISPGSRILCLSYHRALNRPPTPTLRLTGDASLPKKIRRAPAFFARGNASNSPLGGRLSASFLLALTYHIHQLRHRHSVWIRDDDSLTLPFTSAPPRPWTVHALLLYALKADTRLVLAMGFKSRVHLRARQIHGFMFKSTLASPAPPSPCVSSLSLESTLKTFAEFDLLFEKGVSAGTCVDVFDDVHGASAGKGGSGEGEGEGEGSMDGEEGERRID